MPVKKTTIVAADDDPQLLRLVTRNLEFEEYEVLPASDGVLALEQVEAHSPDLVLLDVMMPRMDGFTVCQRIREFSTVPIIIVTARGQDQDKVRGLDLGADDYLTKPFSVDELLARVRAVLRRAQFTANEHTHVLRTTITIGDLASSPTWRKMPAVSSPRIYCSTTSGAQNTSGRATCCRSTSTACDAKSRLIPHILVTFSRRGAWATFSLLNLKCTRQNKWE